VSEQGSGRKDHRFIPAVLIAVTLGVGILIGTVVSRGVRAGKPGSAASDALPLPAPSPVELSNSFAKIADALEPAVVNINTESTIRITARQRNQSPDDSPLDDFFGRFFQFGPGLPPGEIPKRNLGSGVLLDPNGYIMTNYHVVMQEGEDKPVDRIRVFLHGDDNPVRGYEARIIGTDRYTDLAVIKVEVGKPLVAAPVGDSDAARVGDWVLAIGSPFGLDSTVTAGIVSAKGRDIEGGPEGQFKRFIQTDAAINPGNSGGPLVNLAGQVVGINTAIATRRGTYDGVGFAIPSNTARKVYNSIIATGGVRRGAIGVQFYSQQNPALLRSFGADHGVVINVVEPKSPAERAGLKRGDVIVAVDGKSIRTGDALVAIVSESDIGAKLKLDYLRDAKPASTVVEVGDRSKVISELNEPPENEQGEEQAPETGGGVLGLSVRSLTTEQKKELAEQLHLDGPQGVLVSNVKSDGFAADLGIQRGDLILSINHRPLASAEEFSRLQAQLKPGTDVLVLIARRGIAQKFTTLYLADRLP
jgi:serine protease Do